MKRAILKTAAVFALALALSLTAFVSLGSEVYAAGSAIMPRPVANDYSSKITNTYMVAVGTGYMRVINDNNQVYIEYYDSGFNLTSTKALSMELPIWGGFYSGSDAYYLVQGQSNTNGVDNTEVVRIIKYDKSWNRLGAGKILAKEGWEYEIRYPFDYSCVNMTEADGKLYVVTGREGYVDPQYGQGHQGMMLIRMDESSLNTEIVYGDFWHSFSQYIANNGTDIYLYEQSEGGRCTEISKFDGNSTGTDYFEAFTARFSVFDYGGTRTSAWSIPCYATADDIAISSSNALGIGTSIDQSKYDSYNWDTTPYNIYLTVTPLSNFTKEATQQIWLTNYKNTSKAFSGVALTKINDDRFLVTWEEDDYSEKYSDRTDLMSNRTLHYLFIDGAGNKLSKEYKVKAAFSNCHPILSGSNVVYCASSSDSVNFYTINVDNGSFSKKIYNTIENAYVYGIVDKVYTGKAIKIKPTVSTSSRDLVYGTDYTLSYKNNKKVGTATITINGKGAFSGTKTVKFKILPKATSIKTLKAGKKSLAVVWKKQAKQTTGYEIQYSTDKKFKKAKKTAVIKKAKTTKKTIKKLKTRKKYYVRIRTYKTVGGKKYYSKWSKVKTIKIK